MKTYISKEDAEAIIVKVLGKSNWPVNHYMSLEQFHEGINLAIAKVIGEPVGYTDISKETLISSVRYKSNAALVNFSRYSIPLYAIKELPNEPTNTN